MTHDELTAAVEAELARLIGQPEFANSDRMSRFLRYSVERSLAGDRVGLKESVIGAEVFDRPPGYDPKADPVVRNEARRLRAKLEDSYARVAPPRVRISVPKGSYAAVFEPVAITQPQSASAPPETPPHPEAPPRRRWYALAAAVVVTVIGASLFLFSREPNRGLPSLSTITSYPGRQVFPCPSPDGTEVAYQWGGETGEAPRIYVTRIGGGGPRRLTANASANGPAEGFPAWSPDGTRIAFLRSDKIVIARASGGEDHDLTKAYSGPIAWSPDGRSLVFSDSTVPTSRGLFSADALTGARRQLTSPSAGVLDQSPAFSPDGTRIAFVRCSLSNCDAYVIPSVGGEPRQLTQEHTGFSGLTWSPDGRVIVFASRRLGPYQLWQIPASGGKPESISVAGDEALYPRFASRPGSSTKLVYEQRIEDSNIWTVPLARNASGPVRFLGDPTRLISSTRLENSPRASPDGRKIVFVSNRSGFGELWTVNTDGSDATAVTQMRMLGVGSPRWSPDSSRIVFDATGTGGRAVFIVDASGGTPRQWTPYGANGRPSWSVDGASIYYHNRDANGQYVVWKASSTDPNQRHPLITNALDAFESLDGKAVFFIRGDQLWQMPVTGPAAAATQVQTGIPMSHGWWVLAAGAVYFVDMVGPPAHSAVGFMKGPKAVYFYDLRSRELRQIGTITADLQNALPDFAVSPDGSRLYYSAMEIAVSQIRMIEGGF